MRFFTVLALSILLSGCISQESADAKLAKGCIASINALVAQQGKKFEDIKSQSFSDDKSEGEDFRRVTLSGIEKEGWLELDKEYSCLFAQDWGAFKTYHHALLVQIKIDDQIYGKRKGVIEGGFEDFITLVNIAEGAMIH